jgi:hypothetical protein
LSLRATFANLKYPGPGLIRIGPLKQNQANQPTGKAEINHPEKFILSKNDFETRLLKRFCYVTILIKKT